MRFWRGKATWEDISAELGEIALPVAEVQHLLLEPNVSGVLRALENVKLVA